jgi:hypothetical protein
MILLSLFTTGFVGYGGKFTILLLTPVANLPPLPLPSINVNLGTAKVVPVALN